MKIEIIGSNTINGIKLRKKVIAIANSLEDKVIINLIDDYNSGDLPHLYINDTLISKGIIPNDKEILKHLKNNNKD